MYTTWTEHDGASTVNFKYGAMIHAKKVNADNKSKTESFIVSKLEKIRTTLQDWAYENKVILNYRKTLFTYKIDRSGYIKDSVQDVEEILASYGFEKEITIKSIIYRVKKDSFVELISA
jgi:hypothetical protein